MAILCMFRTVYGVSRGGSTHTPLRLAFVTGLASRKPRGRSHLDRYTDAAGTYAFHTYDRLYGPDGPLTPADVLLANLMSLRLGWKDVIPLFADGDGDAQALRLALDQALEDLTGVPSFENHDSPAALEESMHSLALSNIAAQVVTGWTEVTVSKVLHRRRPHAVPIIDSRVRQFYGVRKPARIRCLLWEDIRDNESWLSDLAAQYDTPDGRPLSLLRCADILIWMGD